MTDLPLLFLWLVNALAAFRLTRLVTKDTIIETWRWKLLRKWPAPSTTFPENIVTDRHVEDGVSYGMVESNLVMLTEGPDGPQWEPVAPYKWAELLECPWCSGMYVSAGVVALNEWWGWWPYLALILALSAVVGLVASRLDS